jgi:hypothetical protein
MYVASTSAYVHTVQILDCIRNVPMLSRYQYLLSEYFFQLEVSYARTLKRLTYTLADYVFAMRHSDGINDSHNVV